MIATTRRMRTRKSFLLRRSHRQERREHAARHREHGETKRTPCPGTTADESGQVCHGTGGSAGGQEETARRALRRDAERASQCETWLTLDELAKLTHYPQASISAQLRHLRKPRFGGFELEKRPRASGRLLRGEDYGTVWEYRLLRRVRRISRQEPSMHQGARRGHRATVRRRGSV